MRLKTADYAHPAERLTLLASAWLALTLVLLVEVALVALIVVRPVNAVAAVILGVILLAVFNGGAIVGVLGIKPWLDGLRASARRAGPTRHRRVHEAFERAAGRLAVPGTPPIFVLPSSDLDTFTIAWGIPAVFVTRGLAERLNDLELRAALGHELGHLKGGHSRLLTLVRLPLRAELAHKALLAPFGLFWLVLRWWASLAELSADRAAAIAAGGPEPVAGWLSAAASDTDDRNAEIELHRYLTQTADEVGMRIAEEDLHLAYPGVARRIIAVARFTDSRRFNACLGIVGDLQIPVTALPRDPGSAGILPHVAIGMLAGLWLTPLTLGLTIALGAPQPSAPPPPARQAAEPFSPEVVPDEEPRVGTVAEAERPRHEDPGADIRAQGEREEQLQAMLGLARSYKDSGEYDQAREIIEQVLMVDPSLAEAHYLLAWVHVDAGDRDLARAEFMATINLAPPGSEMYREAEAALERMQ